MMETYISIREAAEKWGVSERRINQYCNEGRIPKAQRIGKAWAIPADAKKPGDPRRMRSHGENTIDKTISGAMLDHANLMPLMNTAFIPGHCRETAETMAAGPRRDIAMAEYHYFTGQAYAADRWIKALYNGQYLWYRTDADGYLLGGWFTETDGNIYYLHPLHDGAFGYMYTGDYVIDGRPYSFSTGRELDSLPEGALIK